MADRRTEILDAALTVLVEHGMHGLTHRAVDAAAAIPPGSTLYYFRRRHALIAGCVDPLVELDLAADAPAVHQGAGDLDTLADTITDIAVDMITTGAPPHAGPLRAQPRGGARCPLRAVLAGGQHDPPRRRRPPR